MFYLRIVLMALRGLQANLLRSLLATLGVVIGVAAVVSAISILEGMKKDIVEKFQSLGSDLVVVVPGSSRSRGRSMGLVETLTEEDATAIANECDLVKATAPEVLSAAQIKYFNKNKLVTILGTNELYSEINNYKPARGAFISREDVRSERKVVVLGYKIAKDLFGETPAVGFRVKIKGTGFTVIGVMEKKGFLGFRQVDSEVVVPVTTAMKRLFGVRSVSSITVQAQDFEQLDACSEQVKRVLRGRHGVRSGEHDDFTIFNQEDAKRNIGEVSSLLGVVLYSIAGISLVVGGIGIMNIMLVSVTERTREIGVRMAVGARRGDILGQFLVESSTISFLGGALGVVLGLGFSDLLEQITQVLETYTPARAIVAALVMATMVGIVSGIYPAYKASRLDPVEALRYE